MQGGGVIGQSGDELGPQEVVPKREYQERMVSKLHTWSFHCVVHGGSRITAWCEFGDEEEVVQVFPVSGSGRRGQMEGPAGQTA